MKGQPLIVWGLLIGSWALVRAEIYLRDHPHVPPDVREKQILVAAQQPPIQKLQYPTSIFSPTQPISASPANQVLEVLPDLKIGQETERSSIAEAPLLASIPDSLLAMPLPTSAQHVFDIPILAAAPPSKLPPSSAKRQLSWSIWLFTRNSDGASPAPQLGAAQAGGRLTYGLLSPTLLTSLSASVRLARPLEGRGFEISPGLSLSGGKAIPVEMIIERRIRPEKGNKDQWGVLLASGIAPREIRPGLTVEGFAQAGFTGTKTILPFAQMGAGIHRSAYSSPIAKVKIGAGLWADGQGKVGRIEIGPEIVTVVDTGALDVRVSAQWRIKVAGNAKPGSGPALSLSTSF